MFRRSLLSLTSERRQQLQRRLRALDAMEPFVRESDHLMNKLRSNIANNERNESRSNLAAMVAKAEVKQEEEEEVAEDWWDEAQKQEVVDADAVKQEQMDDGLMKQEIKPEEEEENGIHFSSAGGKRMTRQLEELKRGRQYQKMLEFRKKLPAFQMREELVRLIRDNQVVVISGETGCGKTTQVPQFVLDDVIERGLGNRSRVVCTQPRRISAISIAERVADERGERCGGDGSSVGYQIRLESRLPRHQGSILYCTTGVVLQWMRSSPNLDDVSHIVLDEIHERDIMSDFLITILKDLLPLRRDLKVILMSATLNAELFSRYFGNCPMVNIPGFTYPVEEFYLEDVLEMTHFPIQAKQSKGGGEKWHRHTARGKKESAAKKDFEDFIEPYIRDMTARGKYSRQTLQSLSCQESEETNHELIATLVNKIHREKGEGAVLVFLPGWEDISKVNKLLTEDQRYFLGRDARIYPLHSLMPTATQKEIFQRPPDGIRKVVIATNIAETSITIDDVVFVVDCGKIKMSNFDVEANIATLKPEWVSLANARQRRGRAGRVQPGICYHLYSRAREMTLNQFVVPEMLRTRLEEVVLQIKSLELGRASSFLSRVMESPSEESITLAIELLTTISALDDKEQLTPLGYHLSQLPMDPQTGKMILLGAIFSCLDPVLSVAASLTFKDAFVVPLGKEEVVDAKKKMLSRGTRSDHLMMANVIIDWEDAMEDGRSRDFCWDYFLSESTLRMLDNMKKQFAQHLRTLSFLESANFKLRSSNRNSNNEDLVRAVICAGLYPNVASIKVKRSKTKDNGFPILSTLQERKVSVHPKSINAKECNFEHPWCVYHVKMQSTSTFVHDCTEVSPMSLIFFGKRLQIGQDNLNSGQVIETISVDRFVKFNCARDTGIVFKVLRRALDELLEFKVSHPGVTNWESSKREGFILETIIELLSSRPEGSSVQDDYEDF